MEKYLDVIKSVVIGHAVADAVGVPVEFKTREKLDNAPVTDMREFGTHNMPKGTCNIKHATIPKEEDKDEKNNDRRVNPQTPTRPGVIPNPPKNIDPSIVDRISPTKPNNTAPNNVSPKVPTPTTPTAPKTN